MNYSRSDGPFGLLPKKTAMELESTTTDRLSAPWVREAGSSSQRFAEIDIPIPGLTDGEAAEAEPPKKDG